MSIITPSIDILFTFENINPEWCYVSKKSGILDMPGTQKSLKLDYLFISLVSHLLNFSYQSLLPGSQGDAIILLNPWHPHL